MPTSWFQVIPAMLSRGLVNRPRSVLDIGAGFGKYGALLRETLNIATGYHKDQRKMRIEGAEAFPDYLNPIHSYAYNHLY